MPGNWAPQFRTIWDRAHEKAEIAVLQPRPPSEWDIPKEAPAAAPATEEAVPPPPAPPPPNFFLDWKPFKDDWFVEIEGKKLDQAGYTAMWSGVFDQYQFGTEVIVRAEVPHHLAASPLGLRTRGQRGFP